MIIANAEWYKRGGYASQQLDHIHSRRKAFEASQLALATMAMNSGNVDGYQINSGIPTEDFWRLTDKTLQGVRTNTQYLYMDDLNDIATPLPLGKLVLSHLTTSDISDDISVTMDIQNDDNYDSITTGKDADPIPVYTGGVQMGYRQQLGLQTEAIDLMQSALARKTFHLREKMGKYMYSGNSKIEAGGVKGQGITNHRNTKNISSTSSKKLTAMTMEEIYEYFRVELKKVCIENAIPTLDRIWVSSDIMFKLTAEYSGADGYKEGTVLERIQRLGHIGEIKEDYSLTGDEFLAYVRDREIISPLVAMALSNYQKIRVDPYGPFQTCLIAAQGLKISKTYNNKFGVFYFKKS